MARSVAADVSRRCERMAWAAGEVQRSALSSAALAFKDNIEMAASQSGLRARQTVIAGRRWPGVRYDVKGYRTPVAQVRAMPPAHLHNNDTAQHIIGAKLLGTRNAFRSRQGRLGANLAFGGSNRGAFGGFNLTSTRRERVYNPRTRQDETVTVTRNRSGKRALDWSGARHPSAFAFHPGTRGKGWMGRGQKRGQPRAMEAYRRESRGAVVRAFTGRGL